MAGLTTIHGTRDTGRYEETQPVYAAHFCVVGNTGLVLFNEGEFEGGIEGAPYACAKHVFDYAGSVDQLRIVIVGNLRSTPATYEIRKNNVATGLTYTVPATTDGIFTVEAPFTFEPGDDICGFVSSADTGELQQLGLVQLTIEITPATGVRTAFRCHSDGLIWKSAFSGSARDPIRSTYPLAGTPYTYNAYRTLTGDFGDLAATQVPLQMAVRAPGTFTYLQAALSSFGDNLAVEFYLDVNTLPAIDDASKPLVVELAEATSGISNLVDTAGSAAVVSGDLVSFTGHTPKVVGNFGATIWSLGVNWEGTGSLVDLMTSEDGDYSFDRTEEFDFNPDRDEFTESRKWIVAPIGTFRPELRATIEGTPNPAGSGIPNLALLPYSITPSASTVYSHMRVYCDVFLCDSVVVFPVRVQILIDGFEGDAFVDFLEPGWYVDDNTSDEVETGRSWCYQIQAGGMSPSTEGLYAHISSITVAYGTSPAVAGQAGPRELPEPEALVTEPCLTHRARCWKITRKDGEVFAYTEHDEDVVFAGTTYNACGGLVGSASELGAILGETGNEEMSGYLSDLGIKAADMLGGLFNEAEIEVWYIPWGDWIEVEDAFQLAGGKVGQVEQEDIAFKMEALTPSAQLARKTLVSVVTESCSHTLGDEWCTVDLTSMTATGSVSALAEDDHYALTPKRKFADTTRSEEDDWFTYGIVTWLTGKNAGQSGDVRSYERSGGDGNFILWTPLVYDIEEGDTYRVTPGCDRHKSTCKDKFNNKINFGGYEFLPGPGALLERPLNKAT